MTPVTTERIVLTGIVTLASGIQLMVFAYRVYSARKKHSIEYPAITGHDEFERIFRAQQNTLELYPVYMTTLWTSTIFFHPVPSAFLGMLYLISRQRYFIGYSRSVEGRLPGFTFGSHCLLVMSLLAGTGLIKTLLSIHHGGGMFAAVGHFPRSCRL